MPASRAKDRRATKKYRSCSKRPQLPPAANISCVKMPQSKRPQLRQTSGVPFDLEQIVESQYERDLRISANHFVCGQEGKARRFTVQPPPNESQPPSKKEKVVTVVAAGGMRLIKPANPRADRLQSAQPTPPANRPQLSAKQDDDESDCQSSKSDSYSSIEAVETSTDSCGSDAGVEQLSDEQDTQQTAVAAKKTPDQTPQSGNTARLRQWPLKAWTSSGCAMHIHWARALTMLPPREASRRRGRSHCRSGCLTANGSTSATGSSRTWWPAMCWTQRLARNGLPRQLRTSQLSLYCYKTKVAAPAL